MINWVTIIVEKLHGHWSAWFHNNPGAGYGGDSPSRALERLIYATDQNGFDASSLRPIATGTRDGHLEYAIRYVGTGELPEPSLN